MTKRELLEMIASVGNDEEILFAGGTGLCCKVQELQRSDGELILLLVEYVSGRDVEIKRQR